MYVLYAGVPSLCLLLVLVFGVGARVRVRVRDARGTNGRDHAVT